MIPDTTSTPGRSRTGAGRGVADSGRSPSLPPCRLRSYPDIRPGEVIAAPLPPPISVVPNRDRPSPSPFVPRLAASGAPGAGQVSDPMDNPLYHAFQYHQQGLLDRAGRIYEDVLAGNPNNADALHLLGLVALQQGDPSRAAGLIGRAIAVHPVEASYHANLAEAYRALGRYGEAAD